MPTQRYGKVRKLLRDGLAVVVKREPFTIRLTYDTDEITQPVTLGVDAGTKYVGLSATTENKELFVAEVSLRTDIVKLLAQRRETRQTRRSRKTRYRKVRFNNRRKPEGWYAPSIEQRIQSHLHLIEKVNAILPITKTVIEVAQFDTQLLKNPDIYGEQYQQGSQLRFWNVREYVLARDNHQCQCCHGKSKDRILNVHHIESRQTGGNSPDNLVTLCETCHNAYHRGKVKLNIKRNFASLRDAAVMSTMRWELYNRAKNIWNNVHLTYGYITKHTRITNKLEKSHSVDARCISGNPLAEPCPEHWLMRQRRRHNRQIHKVNILSGGRRKLNQAPYLVRGFRLFDKVKYDGKECFVFGRRSSGSFDIRLIDGTRVHAGINCRKLQFLSVSQNCLILKKRNGEIPPPFQNGIILAHLS